MRIVACLAVAATALTASLAGGAPGPTLFGTRGVIERIAADGTRVALATDRIPKGCDRIVVWNAAAKSFGAYKAGTHCPGADVPSGGQWLGELALAGTRVLWIEGSAGNTEYLTLRTVAPGTKIATVAEAENGSGAGEEPSGDYLGHLYGDGPLLVFNTWSVCMALPPGFDYETGQICKGVQAAGGQPEEHVYQQRLWNAATGAKAALEAGGDAFAAVAADAGRVAVQQGSGKVILLSSTGAVLKKIAVPAGTFSGTALQGNDLVTLRNGKLEVYNAATGALVKTIPLPAGKAALRDVHAGLAVYVKGLEIHVVRLSDGKQATITAPGTKPVDAQIEAAGLFYSYTLPKSTAKGRVVFLPLAELEQKL